MIISKDLIELLNYSDTSNKYLTEERDGMFFVKYLNGKTHEENWQSIKKSIPNNISESPSIRHKQLWLIDYYNHEFPDNVHINTERFVSPK